MKKIAAIVCLIFGLLANSQAACPQGSDKQATLNDLAVTTSAFRVVEGKEGRSIVTVGTIKNSSPVCIDNIQLEIRYFDAKGSMIDTFTRKLYELEAPSQEEIGFRVYADAVRLKDAYASQTIRVVSFGTPKKEKKQDERSLLVDLIVSWGPMLLLIGVWVFFSRKMSPMGRLVIEQNRLIEAQVKMLERIAIASETRSRSEKASD